MTIQYATIPVGESEIFYREAGPANAPVLLLLHGFPTASHMFRDLMPLLADRFRVIAPDMPGFGNSVTPDRGSFQYRFDTLAEAMAGFVDALGVDRYAIYVFDYGAPVGLRLAMRRPEQVTAIISQNGNAYLDGIGDDWGLFKAYWADPSAANREACRAVLGDDAIRFQYQSGAPAEKLSPDGYTLDLHRMHRPGAEEIQLDLILDYQTNLALYPAFQRYFRDAQPPLLAVWGRRDPFFKPAGAEAYHKDLPQAEIHLLETGHFALETHADEIAMLIRDFLDRVIAAPAPISLPSLNVAENGEDPDPTLVLQPEIAAYFASESVDDTSGLERLFTADAIVSDEAQKHRGVTAIKAWKREAKRKTGYSVEPIRVEQRAGRTLVSARLAGDFPGSPATVTYAFTLAHGRVSKLEIG